MGRGEQYCQCWRVGVHTVSFMFMGRWAHTYFEEVKCKPVQVGWHCMQFCYKQRAGCYSQTWGVVSQQPICVGMTVDGKLGNQISTLDRKDWTPTRTGVNSRPVRKEITLCSGIITPGKSIVVTHGLPTKGKNCSSVLQERSGYHS